MREDAWACSFMSLPLAIFFFIPILSTAIFVPDSSRGDRENIFIEYKKYYKDRKKLLRLLPAAEKPLQIQDGIIIFGAGQNQTSLVDV
jgi:hypothetical protein